MIWVFTYLNIRGAKLVGDSSKLFGVIVLSPFIIMTVIGLFKMQYNPLQPFVLPGESAKEALNLGLFVVMWNYLGWDGLSTVAGEMKNPRRDYPKTLIITLPLITLCYLIPVVIGLGVVGVNGVEWTAGAWNEIAKMIGGSWLGILMAIGALVSAAGLFSALLLSVTRIPFVMGEDGYLPKVLFRTHKRYGTPWVSLVVSSAIYSVFILGPFQSLVVVDVTIYAAALLLEFAALVVLRVREPDMERPYRIPGGMGRYRTRRALPARDHRLRDLQPGAGGGVQAVDRPRGAVLGVGPDPVPDRPILPDEARRDERRSAPDGAGRDAGGRR